MIKLAGRNIDVARYGSERAAAAAGMTALAAGWLLALGGLIGTLVIIAQTGWVHAFWVAVLFLAFPFALWMTRRVAASRRLRLITPPRVLDQRHYGTLDAIADSEWRPLRPIGMTAREAADRTGILLTELLSVPSVRIFHGVRPAGPGLPPVPHAISAGRHLILLESVAWPPGRYEAAADGRIRCDGVYIGQSAGALRATVRQWAELLPRNHHVMAVVVVHPAGCGEIAIPPDRGREVGWVLAGSAVTELRRRMTGGGQAVSRNAIAVLADSAAVDVR
jgi:hypothetical protein